MEKEAREGVPEGEGGAPKSWAEELEREAEGVGEGEGRWGMDEEEEEDGMKVKTRIYRSHSSSRVSSTINVEYVEYFFL